MKPSDSQDLPFSAFILALFLGVFSSLAIATGLIVIDAPAWGTYLFAALGGVTAASFVWIERSLVFQIKEKELLLGFEVTRRQEFQDYLYSHSMACLVRFDAGTLIIDRTSPGFIKMLRMPMESELQIPSTGQGWLEGRQTSVWQRDTEGWVVVRPPPSSSTGSDFHRTSTGPPPG